MYCWPQKISHSSNTATVESFRVEQIGTMWSPLHIGHWFFVNDPLGGMNPFFSSATSTKFRLDVAKVWVELGLDVFPHSHLCVEVWEPSLFLWYPPPPLSIIPRDSQEDAWQFSSSYRWRLHLHNNCGGAWWKGNWALAVTLGWPNCSFRHFRAVAYIMPFDPRPEIARSASLFKSMHN